MTYYDGWYQPIKPRSEESEIMRYKVYEVGFLKWSTDDFQAARERALACSEYAYIIDTVTGERVDIGGPVSG